LDETGRQLRQFVDPNLREQLFRDSRSLTSQLAEGIDQIILVLAPPV
jgi:hypothetical protein